MFTHIDEKGRPKMVEVGQKKDTKRVAIACGVVKMSRETLEKIQQGQMKKGDVLATAQVAGIMAVKRTSESIPMCHPILITGVDMDFDIDIQKCEIRIECRVKTMGKTGVEMEAMHGVSVAALTIYDMCKAVQRDISIHNIYLLQKEGGKSGLYKREG